jgi:hypothetical protein
LKSLVKILSKRARSKRAEIFKDYLNPIEQDKILDLGGGDGSYIASVIPSRANIYIADIKPESLAKGRELFGFNTILIDENGRLDFPDGFFDIVFCSSVIEHVTVRKDDIRCFRTNREFFSAAYRRQREFAEEVQRVGKRYFVQTPNKYFLIESHTWLPFFIVLMPRSWQITMIDFFNKWWPKKTSPDWNLLTKDEMQDLFPEAEIVLEKVFGFTKSIMAIKR